ncbi:hypothetical protein CO057_02500 [Candidatus Uhrbacteria bacterium CG_4_9_14_0_2_um_filter_41_50]|uniref:Uncharacterized protein n=1 Tax=Candidatus Uhrbacteria bacterium CG_4_9_14_0_2_um_filter_41_50 TaxID=1975031 RepID=A0A2M8EP49_9BACT|nr:MAG: hypothetical protein COZ45_04355 [Candidatus Uhrbacteria bacterium CG_4_10_14_3_um_filter_41_21]PIZ55082.1 MAG: hypothetical protein COY24_01795 [Candidatus Uhrbacteria bacterium CG_4_10_14_0_2_um_filter_41_21]PJB85005.1 MAG: hypothetical protein CO086_00645 [Candidatus Uhrbacteria bacterium CG_4_9_14_0_8_um_filter_41_16]PJC24512.1 MAG: hypothetical protein CO057_02500 [Candidatus Uhrbacteria bacterium CG_4_9_14_0_2_um_filter_41_50]PJE74738.1 MAG: hypothetical protein COV03_03970 [Candi
MGLVVISLIKLNKFNEYANFSQSTIFLTHITLFTLVTLFTFSTSIDLLKVSGYTCAAFFVPVDIQKTPKKQPSDRYYYLLGVKAAGDFGVTIAIPALIAAYLGKRLDIHFGTSPWLLVLGFTIAFVLTAIFAVRKAKRYAKLYEQGPRD